MPARIRHFLHDSVQAPAVPPVLGTAFATADVHVHDLTAGEVPFLANRAFEGVVAGIHVRLTNAGAPSATKVTIRLCADADGDYTLVPDTEADLVAGVTTTTSQCAAFSVKLPLFQILDTTGNLYLFAKVDDATSNPNFAQSCITWSE